MIRPPIQKRPPSIANNLYPSERLVANVQSEYQIPLAESVMMPKRQKSPPVTVVYQGENDQIKEKITIMYSQVSSSKPSSKPSSKHEYFEDNGFSFGPVVGSTNVPVRIPTPMEARSFVPINKVASVPKNGSQVSIRNSSPNLALSSTRALSPKVVSPIMTPARAMSPSIVSPVKKQLTKNTFIPSHPMHRPAITSRVIMAEPIKTIIAPMVPSSPPTSKVLNYSTSRTSISDRMASPSIRAVHNTIIPINRSSLQQHIMNIPIIRSSHHNVVNTSQNTRPLSDVDKYLEVILYCDEYDPRGRADYSNFHLLQ